LAGRCLTDVEPLAASTERPSMPQLV